MTLLPGTVIMAGTPAVFLKPGDLLESKIEGLGTLVNPVTGVDEQPLQPGRPIQVYFPSYSKVMVTVRFMARPSGVALLYNGS